MKLPERIDFFPGQRRKVIIEDLYPKLNKENEKRIHIKMQMPLLGESIIGMPGSIGAAYDALGKIDNGMLEVILASEFEAMTLEFYPHDQSAAPREQLVTGATLRKLSVSRPAAETRQNDEIMLNFETTIKYDQDLWIWLGSNLGATLFCEFEQAQMTLMPVVDSKAAAANDDSLVTSTEDCEKQMQLDRQADVSAMTDEEKKDLERHVGTWTKGKRKTTQANA